SPGAWPRAPISVKEPSSRRASMRWRGVVSPAASRLAFADSEPGSCANSSRCCRSFSFADTLLSAGAVSSPCGLAWSAESSDTSGVLLILCFFVRGRAVLDHLGESAAHLRDLGLVDDGEVVALQLDDIQLGDDFAPAAVRRNITICRFQLDCTIVHPLGAEEGDRYLDGRPGVEVQGLEDAVVHEAGALVLQHARGQPEAGGLRGLQHLLEHREHGVLTLQVQQIVRNLHLEAVGL